MLPEVPATDLYKATLDLLALPQLPTPSEQHPEHVNQLLRQLARPLALPMALPSSPARMLAEPCPADPVAGARALHQALQALAASDASTAMLSAIASHRLHPAYASLSIVIAVLSLWKKPHWALEVHELALARPDVDAMAWGARGETRTALKDYAGALEDFARAIELAPDAWAPYESRAVVYDKLRRREAARQDRFESMKRRHGFGAAVLALQHTGMVGPDGKLLPLPEPTLLERLRPALVAAACLTLIALSLAFVAPWLG